MYPVSTLEKIAQKVAQQSEELLANTIGCVIDITRPVFRQKENNYISEIKLIDQSFNQFIQNNRLIKFLSVYLISENLDQLKFTSKIGDFVYLHKFMFSMWNGIRLRTKFYGSFECVYQIHSGQIEDDEHFKMERKMGKQNASYDLEFISARIVELKNWVRIHFRQIFNPFIGVKIINNYCSLIEPFTMILKVTRIQKNEFENYLFLTDTNKNSFYLDLKDFTHILFRPQDWVFLRGVKYINTDRQIIFLETGNVLLLPQIFAEQFENQSNYKAIYRKTNKLGTQKKETSTLTYITLFDQKVSTVKQLFDLQDKYTATIKKEDIILQNNYLVKGAVVKYSGKIKLYHTEYQMIVHDKYLDEVPTQQKKSTIGDKKLVYVYEGSLYLVDRSITSKKEKLKVILFTNDSKSTFFDEKELEKLSNYIGYSEVNRMIQDTLKNINSKLQKLKKLSTFESPAALVLEPIRSDRLIFRLINTKIA